MRKELQNKVYFAIKLLQSIPHFCNGQYRKHKLNFLKKEND